MSKFSLCLVLIFIAGQTFAADLANGEKIFKTCKACHGPQGQGNKGQSAPRIAGQHEWYIVKSIEDFLSNKRVNPKMLPFIKNLSKADIQDVAAFVAKLEID